MRSTITLLGILFIVISCNTITEETIGKTTITKWQDDKKSAISLTYDDGIINQFTVARPIMNELGFPGTFYILTGKVNGSAKGKFIGRPINEIISETASIKTNAENFFERASAIGFAGKGEAIEYHSNAGSLFESGKVDLAYNLIDEGYLKLRNGESIISEEILYHNNSIDTTTWNDLKSYAKEGHEIASHTITHPRLAVLDEANMLYELEQSREDILNFLGEKYTFSAEGPYGTENERVMEHAHKIYPALRNRMPEPYLEELNRSSNRESGSSDKEYVQWQRGPLTNTSMEKMKSWVDTCTIHDNIWLVLVFHGVDGIGWESKKGEELEEYFGYIKEREKDLWIATFADVTKYIRERKKTVIKSTVQDNKIVVNISSDLDSKVYDVPITMKTYVPATWKEVVLNKTNKREDLNIQKDSLGYYVLYAVLPNEGTITLIEQK